MKGNLMDGGDDDTRTHTYTRLLMVCLMYSPMASIPYMTMSETLVTCDNHMVIAFNVNVTRMTR
jgi:hypothetical protein